MESLMFLFIISVIMFIAYLIRRANKNKHHANKHSALDRLFFTTDQQELHRYLKERMEVLNRELDLEVEANELIELPNFDPNSSGRFEFEGVVYTSGAPAFWLSSTGMAIRRRRRLEKQEREKKK